MRSSAAPAQARPCFRDQPRSGDAAAIRRIVASTGFFRADEIAIAVELVEERLAKGVEASGYHFVFADRGGGAIGYACFGPIPCSLVSWDLYWIAVEDAAQGQGLGRDLLRRAEDAIGAEDGRTIYIETSSKPQYDATRAFYSACGYKLEHVFADFYAPGDGKEVYSKRL